MLGYTVSTRVGRIFAGETDNVWAPRSPRAGRCGLILLHGSGNPQGYVDPVNQPSSVKLAGQLAAAGIPCIAGDMGGQTWADDTVIARIDAAWTVLRSLYPAMRTDRVCLLGASMGGAAGARYCQLYPDRVAAFVGLIPLLDLVAFYTGNVAGSAAQIGTAWGVTAPAALPATADVAAGARHATKVPFLAGYSTVDTIVAPAWVTAYAAAVGGTTVVTDSTYGHSDQAIGGMPVATVGSFLATHGA